ncbi:hypothetical protein B0J17DRAFT_629835 [Rhizoctonia solani]|nr:hypothetical protein B0J17DRAFT_629835 [Rhizoctonia solani]
MTKWMTQKPPSIITLVVTRDRRSPILEVGRRKHTNGSLLGYHSQGKQKSPVALVFYLRKGWLDYYLWSQGTIYPSTYCSFFSWIVTSPTTLSFTKREYEQMMEKLNVIQLYTQFPFICRRHKIASQPESALVNNQSSGNVALSNLTSDTPFFARTTIVYEKSE